MSKTNERAALAYAVGELGHPEAKVVDSFHYDNHGGSGSSFLIEAEGYHFMVEVVDGMVVGEDSEHRFYELKEANHD